MSVPVFYTHPQSRGRIVHWMIEELGEPCQTVWLEYGGTMKAPECLALNPMGKVPALRDGDTVVTESAAICADRADRFPQRGLAPPPTCCRARRWSMMHDVRHHRGAPELRGLCHAAAAARGGQARQRFE
jgi:glutathione S-transferase